MAAAVAALVVLGISAWWLVTRWVLRERGIEVTGTVTRSRDHGVAGPTTYWVEFATEDGRVFTRKLSSNDRRTAAHLVYDPQRPTRSLRADLLGNRAFALLSILVWQLA